MESRIRDEQDAVEAELLAMFGEGRARLERQHESLAVAGLESIVALIALKAVTGVTSGFAGKLLYGRWRTCTTRRKLNALASELPRASKMSEKVSEDVIRRDVVEVLMLEGLSLDQAEHLTERIVARVKRRSATGESSSADP